MTKRATTIGVDIEYRDTTNYIRATAIGVMVEYEFPPHIDRLTAMGVMIEYLPIAPAQVQGPLVQMMG